MPKSRARGAAVTAGVAFGAAAGIAFGTFILAPNLPDGADSPGTSATDLAVAEENARISAVQADQADSVIDYIAEDLVRDTLKDRPVIVLSTADADESDVADVSWLLKQAGAIDAGRIKLTEAFFDQDSADQLKSIVAFTLPAGAQLSETQLDPGTHAGEALGAAILLNAESGQPQATTEERADLLGALQESGFVEYQEGTILPGQVVVLITGDSDGTGDSGFAAQSQALFARALDSKGAGAVVAGRIHTAADSGVIGILRANPDAAANVSTVDSLDRTWGKVATTLAVREELAGKSGAFGAASSAEAAVPALN